MFRKYAKLVLESGVRFKEGQCLAIMGEPVHWELACEIEAEAYRLGAKLVEFDLMHMQSTVNRSLYQREAYLEYFPEFLRKRVSEQIDQRWSFIRLEGIDNPELAKKIDQKRNATTYRARRAITKPLTLAMLEGTCPWCIAPAATAGWARQIGLPDKQALWELLWPILRLDREDPGQAWGEQAATLARRTQALNELGIAELRFEGPGTDLRIFVNPLASWEGGGMRTREGTHFMPNLPTEEVYTVPEYRKTEGRVQTTRPVTVLGDQVRGAWFVFSGGRVTDYGAEEGKHLLDEYFGMDPKARFLGEVALVDRSSPIYRSGRIFQSILLDENAACHIALGSGFPSAMTGAPGKSEEELDALGCNKSLVHTDFMIGSESVSVVAHTRDGREVRIIREGNFVA
jgi:aminopeptidase